MPHEIAFEKLLDVLENAYNATALDKCKLLVIEAMDRTKVLKSTVTKAAVRRGRKGGNKTAERGPDYFRKIAAMRKTKGGGRPKKQPSGSDTP